MVQIHLPQPHKVVPVNGGVERSPVARQAHNLNSKEPGGSNPPSATVSDVPRGISSVGRALAWHARGHRFDPGILHHDFCSTHYGRLAQLVESCPYKAMVGGSSPSPATRFCSISSAVESCPYKATVGGSIPSSGTSFYSSKYARLAQLVECLLDVQEVVSSSLAPRTTFHIDVSAPM